VHPIPAGRSAVYVAGGVDSLEVLAPRGVESERGDGWRAWWIEDVAAYRWEPYQPPPASYLPVVRLADGRDAWSEVGSAYLREIADRLAPAPALGETARGLVDGIEGDDAKAKALARHVQGLLTYRAVAFGRSARVPSLAQETLDRRYGDCKDHALLLHQLLGSAGVASHLALASLAEDVEAGLPALDQFDHMIVYCASCEGVQFFDVTDKGLDPGEDVPRGLAGERVLVLDPSAPRLASVPAPRPDRHTARTERTIRVQPHGAADVSETIVATGYAAAALRDVLRAYERPLWRDVLARSLGTPGIAVQDVDVRALDAPESPLEVRLVYALDGAFSRNGHGLAGRLPLGFEHPLLAFDRAKDRLTPFEVTTPLRFQSRVRLVPPPGASLPGDAVEASESGRFVRWRASRARRGDALETAFELSREAGRFPADSFETYRGDVQKALDFLQSPVALDGAAPGG